MSSKAISHRTAPQITFSGHFESILTGVSFFLFFGALHCACQPTDFHHSNPLVWKDPVSYQLMWASIQGVFCLWPCDEQLVFLTFIWNAPVL